ncbi:hypothetical protein HaLaN_08705 [Haematococcus lacustris]|uniref:Uncharacterized protein n=1 Tax=Haematococcus lacustris TaxID=44745 RepID=A0A699YRU9_HAELA|nr:hypothetical protein HaLaN_08705 [Haematococcus lacustris]
MPGTRGLAQAIESTVGAADPPRAILVPGSTSSSLPLRKAVLTSKAYNLLPPPLEVATARLAATRLNGSPENNVVGQPNTAVAAGPHRAMLADRGMQLMEVDALPLKKRLDH